MALDDLIAQITDPQEFTRLCNSVFTDIYDEAFQIIDGTRSDNGNDGYVASERRVLAMYCPVKPEQKTDSGYLKKIRNDLAKAVALKQGNKYPIEAWTFIMPRKLSDSVISEMRAIGAEANIRVAHQESTFLANELYRRGHLLTGFPTLQQIDLGAKIDHLTQMLTQQRVAATPSSTSDVSPQPAVKDQPGEARLNQLLAAPPSQEAKSELKAIAYRTTDPILEINVILALFRWFDPSDDDRGELLAFANRGLERSKRCGLSGAEAVFHAQKAALLLWDFNTSLIEGHFAAIADILVPFPVQAIEQTQQRLTRSRRLEESWSAETAAAIDLINTCQDHDAIAGVLVVLGTNMGQLAHTHRHLGSYAKADNYVAECKKLLLAAKDVYAATGDELGATNAVFNLANQLRWHGGKAEALALVQSTIPIAERHGDVLLLQKAKWLQHTLETDEIPDYLAGERRAWTVEPAPKDKKQ